MPNLVVEECDRMIKMLEGSLELIHEEMCKHENMNMEKNLKANIEYFDIRKRIAVQKYERYKAIHDLF